MMTATQPGTATTPARGSGRPAQWVTLTRLLVRDALSYIVTATGVMLACVVVGSLVARWQGWELVGMLDTESLQLRVGTADGGVRIVASLFLLVGAAGVAAVVIPVVLAARTRVYLVAGATRASVAAAQLVTLVVLTAYVLVVTAVVLLVVGRGVDGASALVGAADGDGVAAAAVRATGALLLAMAGGSAIVAVFLRWPWWVGAGLLTVFLVAVPWLVGLAMGQWGLTGLVTWWGRDLAAAAVAAGVYWWVLRRVPVR